MGHAQRQEQPHEAPYGNAEPGISKAHTGQREVLRLEDLVGDVIAYELVDLREVH